MNETIEKMKELTFGTELEYTGISRERAAKAIHAVVGGTIRYAGQSYDAWQVTAPDGRIWQAVADGSLGGRATSAEVVTPILKYDDLETLQAVVRELRKPPRLPASMFTWESAISTPLKSPTSHGFFTSRKSCF